MVLPMILVAAAVAAIDCITKLLAMQYLTEPVIIWRHVLELTLIRNDGMALGFLGGNRAATLLLPVVMYLVAWYLLRNYEATRFTRIVEGLILGGFLGNYVERLITGAVTDMLYFPFLPWFICNVADIAIVAGVVLLMFSVIFRPDDWREKLAKETHDGGQ